MKEKTKKFLKLTKLKVVFTIIAMAFIFYFTGTILSESLELTNINSQYLTLLVWTLLWPAILLIKLVYFLGVSNLNGNVSLWLDIVVWFIAELIYIYIVLCLISWIFKKSKRT